MSLTLKIQTVGTLSDFPATRDETRSRRSATRLCGNCLEVRLDKTFLDRLPAGRESIKVANIGTHYRQPQDVDCPLCCILFRLRPSPSLSRLRPVFERREKIDELRTFSLLERSGAVNRRCSTIERVQLINGNDSWCLAVEPWELHPYEFTIWHLFEGSERHGFVAFNRHGDPSPPLFSIRSIDRHFNPSLARMWLDYCESHHKRLCAKANSQSNNMGLYLIDCNSLTVKVAPQNMQYVALSYVWGVSSIDDTPNFSRKNHQGDVLLPPVLPGTVSDAIDVTNKLGFRYLWVDRYCIDQSDANAKHDQIAQMNSIYHNASLTIIAAAGQDPNYGLPGVSSRCRSEQLAARIGCGDVELLSAMRHPHDIIRSSKWSTRAWTFQEGVLSRRRLVFTDDQTYFECTAMNCYESMLCWTSFASLDKLHMKDRSRFRNAMRAGMFGRIDKQVYGLFDERKLQPHQAFFRFQRMVEQYSARDLTYDSDSLEAFSGILDKFANSRPRVYHIQGIPLLGNETGVNPEKSFLEGLLWQHKPKTGDNFAAGFQKQPRRRTGFTSWSWAGWAGEAEYIQHEGFECGIKSVSLKLEDGSERTIVDYIKYIQQETLDPSTPAVIRIRTAFLPSSVVFSRDLYGLSDISVYYSNTYGFRWGVRLLSPSKFYEDVTKNGFRKCIYIGESSVAGMVFIVLEPNGSTWSRAGLLFVPTDMLPRGKRSWRRNIRTFSIS